VRLATAPTHPDAQTDIGIGGAVGGSLVAFCSATIERIGLYKSIDPESRILQQSLESDVNH
jgi:hypothetical protein